MPSTCTAATSESSKSWNTHVLRVWSHLHWQLSTPPLHQPRRGVQCCSVSQAQCDQDLLYEEEGWQAAGKDHWRNVSKRSRFHASSERVKSALEQHRVKGNKEQHKYQGDLEAIVSLSQCLFKDLEYLDSFSFPVRNQRIFLETFLLFRHLSNTDSLYCRAETARKQKKLHK